MIRGILSALTDGVVRRFSATGRDRESFSSREFVQHYGFSSAPQPGAELFIAAAGNIILAIASDDRRYRLALQGGEVALYDDLGQKVHLTRAGIEATSPTKITATAPQIVAIAEVSVTLQTPITHCTGNLAVDGGITCSGTYGASGGAISTPGNISSTGGNVSDATRTMAADRAIYNGHTHSDPQGGSVGGPNQGM